MTWVSVLRWGWRAAPGWLCYTAATLLGNAVTSVLYPVGLALVINASLRHQGGQVLQGHGVGDLVQEQAQPWVEPPAGRAVGDPLGGLD